MAWEHSGLKPGQIIGFGGQLDVNRLKYLIFSDINDYTKDIEVNFIGEHGKRGIPVFREKVSSRKKIIDHAKDYFGIYLSGYNASTYGTATELAKLVDALMSEKEKIMNISYYDSDNGIFITWPCTVNRVGIKPVGLDLDIEEKIEFDNLIKIRNEEIDI